MHCPKCCHEWKLPGPQAGGQAKVAKGFAVSGQPDAAARKRGWKTRNARAKRSPNAHPHGRATARTVQGVVGHSGVSE
jgi:hypothetical protein